MGQASLLEFDQDGENGEQTERVDEQIDYGGNQEDEDVDEVGTLFQSIIETKVIQKYEETKNQA